jgi:hypothetical protein
MPVERWLDMSRYGDRSRAVLALHQWQGAAYLGERAPTSVDVVRPRCGQLSAASLAGLHLHQVQFVKRRFGRLL